MEVRLRPSSVRLAVDAPASSANLFEVFSTRGFPSHGAANQRDSPIAEPGNEVDLDALGSGEPACGIDPHLKVVFGVPVELVVATGRAEIIFLASVFGLELRHLQVDRHLTNGICFHRVLLRASRRSEEPFSSLNGTRINQNLLSANRDGPDPTHPGDEIGKFPGLCADEVDSGTKRALPCGSGMRIPTSALRRGSHDLSKMSN